MLERGLVEIGSGDIGFRARFTPAGIDALRLLARDRRGLDPKQYAISWRTFGYSPPSPVTSGQHNFESLQSAATESITPCRCPPPAGRAGHDARRARAVGQARPQPQRPAAALVAHHQLVGVRGIMQVDRLDGPHVSPKELRHGFGVAAVTAGTPLNLVQRWLGHAQLSITAIYADAVCAEEKDVANRIWERQRGGAFPDYRR